MSVFGVFIVHIFLHLDWIRRDTLYLSVFSPNAAKYGPEKLQIRTLFTQCILIINFRRSIRVNTQIKLSENLFKGRAQFIFLCNPPKSSVNVCLMKILKGTVTKKWFCVLIIYMKKTFKSSSFWIISNFHNGFVWNPSKVQRLVFEWITRFL